MAAFDNLCFTEKCVVLRDHGHFITSINFFHYTINLYSLGRFFIEVFYDNELEELTRIASADDTDMKKYLSLIDLSELKAY